jgi:hypothetical protein
MYGARLVRKKIKQRAEECLVTQIISQCTVSVLYTSYAEMRKSKYSNTKTKFKSIEHTKGVAT